jgi:hypothetical protein
MSISLYTVLRSGPLHGLPISVKDCVDVKGYDTTVGMYRRNLEQLLAFRKGMRL